jgi:hypothetical protein
MYVHRSGRLRGTLVVHPGSNPEATFSAEGGSHPSGQGQSGTYSKRLIACIMYTHGVTGKVESWRLH